ncbi:hypothetical protein K443DRAFT_326933 [Laccaria amethystina LaAM-08-1]|uniref:Uncharacterized protein n=1 Tax=Laccaria amethystina LaAM-08-1 TaxID=1095629 RepID=A0A0C9X138_9AGAR|nr:hypothetical protein K443DRAFT_326933 [Laccaria amethystina LaAM-08-1]
MPNTTAFVCSLPVHTFCFAPSLTDTEFEFALRPWRSSSYEISFMVSAYERIRTQKQPPDA